MALPCSQVGLQRCAAVSSIQAAKRSALLLLYDEFLRDTDSPVSVIKNSIYLPTVLICFLSTHTHVDVKFLIGKVLSAKISVCPTVLFISLTPSKFGCLKLCAVEFQAQANNISSFDHQR